MLKLRVKNEISIDIKKMPKEIMESFARATLEAAKRYYSDPEAMKKYQKWLSERQ